MQRQLFGRTCVSDRLAGIGGELFEVLVEQENFKENYWEGHTKEYLKVVFKCDHCSPNNIVMVKIIEIKDEFAIGRLN